MVGPDFMLKATRLLQASKQWLPAVFGREKNLQNLFFKKFPVLKYLI